MQERVLCYEIHGAAGDYFNFISDECVSVNAHYVERLVPADTSDGSEGPEFDNLNFLDEIGVRAVDNSGRCVEISVALGADGGCRPTINGEPRLRYSSRGVGVRTMGGNVVSISVPNCLDTDLEMTVACESLGGVDMIRFMVTRGLNLREESHGLIGEGGTTTHC